MRAFVSWSRTGLATIASPFLALALLVPGVQTRPSRVPPDDQNISEVQLPGGPRLRYVEQGPTDGPVVLLLHGYTDTAFSFSRVLPLLPPSLRVIAPDQRGHGGSDQPGTYSLDDFATDGIRLLDALRVKRATIVGHSMGSFVARRMAALKPERVERLVLVGAGPKTRTPGIEEFQKAVDALRDPPDPAFVREFQVGTVTRPVPQEFMDRVIADSGRMPASVWKAVLAGLLDYRPSESDVRCPTLILGGDRDTVFSRAEQEDLATRIRGAKVQIVPGVGHALHWEDPELFVRELVAFLAR